MVDGMIPIILEVNGAPLRVIWINRDVNSPLAFRPLKYDMKVSVYFFLKKFYPLQPLQ